MFQSPPREKPWQSWTAVAVWSLVIFSAIPFARAVQAWAADRWGGDALRWFAIAVIAAAAAVAVLYLWRRVHRATLRNVLWIGGSVAVFAYLALFRMKSAGEAIHFLEYGFLGLLAFRALSHRLRDPLVYACAALIAALIGTADEIVQWATPGRFWDVRDLTHNTIAAVLAQVTLAGGMRPPFIRGPVADRSVRWLCGLAAMQLILIGLCFSNTPVAVDWYTDRVRALAFLRHNESAMSEYGYRHEIPDLGRFYSRFRLEDLARLDARRGEEAGQVLRHYTSENTYSNFLLRYTPATDPFVHEAMVHLFRRNVYAGVMWKYRDDPDLYRMHATVAYRENQILEMFFPATLEAAGHRWPPERRDAMRSNVNVDRRYRSPVSKHLITKFSEREIWHIIAGLLALDLVFLLWKGRPRESPAVQPS